MSKLMLLGARQFLDMPKGTFYIQHWKRSGKDCESVIERFKANPLSLLDFCDLEIYGNNSGSMCFSGKEDDFIFFYDANVVGDSDPLATVYLVLDDSFIPEVAQYESDVSGYDYKNDVPFLEKGLTLTREQVFKAREEFLSYFDNLDNISDKSNDWARRYSDDDVKNGGIYNLRLECDID